MALNADRADPLMRQLADRLPALRKGAMLNQAELGNLMRQRRSDWSRSTVVKIENGKRRSLSVGELLDLAHVLGVPPVILIADPRYPAPVPLGLIRDPVTDEERPAEELPAWDVLLWITGASVRSREELPITSSASANLVDAGRQLKELVVELGGWVDSLSAGSVPEETVIDVKGYSPHELPLIERLERQLNLIKRLGASLPAIPDWMYDKARAAGVTLPTDQN